MKQMNNNDFGNEIIVKKIHDLEKLILNIKAILEDLQKSKIHPLKTDTPSNCVNNGLIYNNKTLSDELGISQKTLKKYRDRGLINYSQIFDKCYYHQKDVEDFLAKFRTDFR